MSEKIVTLQDSGTRRTFETGAVRDISYGKGRCDLLPLKVIEEFYKSNTRSSGVLGKIGAYVETGDSSHLDHALRLFAEQAYNSYEEMFLEVSRQYEDGAEKYVERNWERGMPLHCFIDSGVRHFLKYQKGDKDEPHDRAFVWNILGALWTHDNKPEFIDLPFINIEKGFGNECEKDSCSYCEDDFKFWASEISGSFPNGVNFCPMCGRLVNKLRKKGE